MSQHEPTSVGPDDADAFPTQHLGHAVEVEHVGERAARTNGLIPKPFG